MPTYDWESPAGMFVKLIDNVIAITISLFPTDLARTAIFYCDELLKIKLEAVLLNEISFTNVLELLDLAITLNYEVVKLLLKLFYQN